MLWYPWPVRASRLAMPTLSVDCVIACTAHERPRATVVRQPVVADRGLGASGAQIVVQEREVVQHHLRAIARTVIERAEWRLAPQGAREGSPPLPLLPRV